MREETKVIFNNNFNNQEREIILSFGKILEIEKVLKINQHKESYGNMIKN